MGPMTPNPLEGRRMVGDGGHVAVLGCTVTASRWIDYVDAYWAARFLDRIGCGAEPCSGVHEVIDTRGEP